MTFTSTIWHSKKEEEYQLHNYLTSSWNYSRKWVLMPTLSRKSMRHLLKNCIVSTLLNNNNLDILNLSFTWCIYLFLFLSIYVKINIVLFNFSTSNKLFLTFSLCYSLFFVFLYLSILYRIRPIMFHFFETYFISFLHK